MTRSIHTSQRVCGRLKDRKYYGSEARNTIRQMNSPSGLIVCQSLKHHLEEQGFRFDVDADNKSVYDPNKLWDALGKYVKPPEFNPDEKAFEQACALAMRAFGPKGVGLKALPLDEELLTAIKPTKSSGAPSFKSKGEAFHVDLARAKRIVAGERAFDPCVAYHRVQHGQEGPKTRLVWGYPLSATLMEARFARPLIEHFIEVGTDHPMAFGRRRYEIGAMTQRVSNARVKVGLDYSGFDSSIHPRLIDRAFGILRKYFDFSEEEETTWEKIVWYFIHTPILMPDGFTYKKHHGVPSGSYFTQLIDSIVNYISVQYMNIREFGTAVPEGSLFVLGDDSIFSIKSNPSMHRLAQLAMELGLKVNTIKSEVSVTSKFDFLGHTWSRGIVHRDLHDIAKRVVFPEKFNRTMTPQELVATRMISILADSVEGWSIYKKWAHGLPKEVMTLLCRKDVRLDEPVFGFQEVQNMQRTLPWRSQKSSLRFSYLGLLL